MNRDTSDSLCGDKDASTTRIVGLGASAGGLEPLEQFFARVPANTGLAFVVVQHLDPTHKAMLSELLQRTSPLPVREVTAAMRVQPDTVYVIPPNTELTVINGVLHLAEPRSPRGMRLPVDVFFCSLARDQGDRSIGVVLSGMGADGTVGLQAIKSQGGLCVVQEPRSAQFDSMPRSAIAAGAADIVANPAELPQRILYVTHAHLQKSAAAVDAPKAAPSALESIVDLLHVRHKLDLRLYKPSTLRRRIERRMTVHRVGTMPDYLAVLLGNTAEVDLLFKEVLIGVTSFFRDSKVWEELRSTVLPELLASAEPGKTFRAWVPGCSTGEEAYSLAIAFREALESLGGQTSASLQIFATDLSADAIAFARRGQYPEAIAADVSAPRLERFFRAQSGNFQIDSRIREMVLFAQHDVIMDPPFTRLDVLCCRNLLIYFTAKLQKRLVPLFHYSLRTGGILILGGSEAIGTAHDMFSVVSSKSRIYRRGAERLGAVDYPINRPGSARAPEQEVPMSRKTPIDANVQAFAEQLLVQKFAPPAVLVNETGDILYVSGRTGDYLEPAAGKANWNVHAMAGRRCAHSSRPPCGRPLRIALRSMCPASAFQKRPIACSTSASRSSKSRRRSPAR